MIQSRTATTVNATRNATDTASTSTATITIAMPVNSRKEPKNSNRRKYGSAPSPMTP
jgi:hypothetical protein